MPSVSLQLSPLDHKRAHELVFRRVLNAQPVNWTGRVVLAIVSVLYIGALFVIATAPNNLDPHTLRLLRGSSVALIVAPLLFLLLLVFERRRRFVAASASLPAPPDKVRLAATDEGLFIVTPGVKTEFQWAGVGLAVQDSEFAALALPRAAPLPLPARAFPSSSDYFAFLRAVQEFSHPRAA